MTQAAAAKMSRSNSKVGSFQIHIYIWEVLLEEGVGVQTVNVWIN